jgi:uncharacterized protein YjbI with pentapeptide repeats
MRRCPQCWTETPADFPFCISDGSPLPRVSAIDWPEYWQARLRSSIDLNGQRLIPIERRIVGIGRHPMNDIVIDDERVASYAAQLTLADGGFAISGVSRPCRVLINGAPLRGEQTLQPDDRIQLADVILVYEELDPRVDAVPPRCEFKRDYRACGRPVRDDDDRWCLMHAPLQDKDTQAFWQMLNLQLSLGDLDFAGYVFPTDANFAHGRCRTRADFSGTTFHGRAVFGGAKFYDGADFTQAHFCQDADFSSAAFRQVTFSQATVTGALRFHFCGFQTAAKFDGMTIGGEVDFSRAGFDGTVDFAGSRFAGPASFAEATFSGWTNFSRVTFGQGANFEGAHLSKEVYFFDTVGLNGVEPPS